MQFVTAEKILIDGKLRTGQAIASEDGEIELVLSLDDLPAGAVLKDHGNTIIAPGFFDLQVNGGGGVLLNDEPNLSGIKSVATAHRNLGTTSLLPTLITDTWEKMERMADAISEAIEQKIAGVKGVHFEGPYLCTEKKGVHNANYIREEEEKFLELISTRELGAVLVTLAPEMVSKNFIKALVQVGAIVSAGHSNATYEETKTGLEAGITGFTHLFNAMPPMLSRNPGVIGAALEDASSYCGIIVDGHHVHPATLKTAIAAKSHQKMMLVSDAMPPVGGSAKSFYLNDQMISVEGGRCLTEKGTLAGACISMGEAVENCVSMLDLDLHDALSMASQTPAAFMKLNSKIGSIQKNGIADLVLLTPEGKFIKVL
ncbi:MAG: N-acetylglucosamine-6-phosphate deacetylase [Sneathiella sp.]